MVNLAELVKSIQALQKNLEIVNKKVEDLRKSFDAVEKFIKKISGEELTIAYENFMHDQGQRPCDGVWDRKIGKCVIKVNTPPKANAGVDIKVNSGDQVRLTGTATDNENNIIKVKWSQLGGTPIDLIPTADGYGATFIAPSDVGDLEFEFYVEDDAHLNDRDQIVVSVAAIPTDPVLNVIVPSNIEVLNSAVIDASTSVADTVETRETTSKNIQLNEISKWKWQFFAPDSTSSYNLGFESKAVKGNRQSIKQVNISVTKPDGGGGDEFDAFGMKYLLKPTTKKVAMEKGSDHRNGQRYNVNHKFENHLMQGYYLLGKGQDKIETKEDGPNHGSCDFTTDQICFWWEAGVDLATGKGESQYEWPHADNYDIPDSKNDLIDSVGQLNAGNWVGWATACYWGTDGLRHYKAWCDPNPFDSQGKPLNNWKLVIHLRHTADLITNPEPIIIPRDMQKVMDYDQGFECEIRMNRATNHDTEMKNAWVFEVIPPT